MVIMLVPLCFDSFYTSFVLWLFSQFLVGNILLSSCCKSIQFELHNNRIATLIIGFPVRLLISCSDFPLLKYACNAISTFCANKSLYSLSFSFRSRTSKNSNHSVMHFSRSSSDSISSNFCNGVQREHNKKLNNGLPILHKVPPKRDYGRYFCIMAEKGGTSHGGLTEKLSLFFHAKKQEVNAYGR